MRANFRPACPGCGAPLIRDRTLLLARNDPGSAAHRDAVRRVALRPRNAILARMGLVPAIDVLAVLRKTWMRGTSPRMTWIYMSGNRFSAERGHNAPMG
jgi:hypothetical protein